MQLRKPKIKPPVMSAGIRGAKISAKAAIIRFGGVVEDETHPGDTVRNCCDVLLAAYQLQKLSGILLIFTHS